MKRRIIIRTAIGLAAIAGLLIVSGVALYGWSQSESGRAWVAPRIAALASVSGEREVTIGRLAGDLYRTIQVEDVSVRDNAGVWLSVGSAEIHWRPWALLRGRVVLDRLYGKDVMVTRAPVVTAGAPTDPGEVLRAVARLRLDDVAITDLTLGPAVFGEKAVLRIKGSAGVSDGESIRASLALQRVDGAAGQVSLSVAYPLTGENLDVNVRVDEPAQGLLARLLEIPDLPALHGRLTGTGPLSAWAGDAEVAFESFATLSAKFAIHHGTKTAFDVSGNAALDKTGAARVVAMSGWRDIQAVMGDRVAWHVSGDLDSRRRRITTQRMDLSGAFGVLSGSGRYDIGEGAGTAKVALRDSDLSRWAPVLGRVVNGQADLNADVVVREFGAKVSAHVRGGARGLEFGQNLVDRLLTPTPKIDSRLAFAQGKLTVSETTVTSDTVALRLDGAIQFSDSTVAADYRLTVPDNVPLPVSDAVEIGCRCLLEGKISGPLGDPGTAGRITAAVMTAGGEPLRDLSLDYQLRNLGSGLDGALDGGVGTKLGRFVARTDLRVAENRVRLSGLHVEGAEAMLDGALEIPADGGPVTGGLQARIAKLRPWLGVAGIEGSGSGEFRATFRSVGKRQGAELTADIADAGIDEAGDRPAIKIDRLTAKATSDDLYAGTKTTATVDARGTAYGDARIRQISVRVSGSPSRAAVTASADGDWGEPVSLRTKFVFTANKRQNRIAVSSLEGRAFNENLALEQPLQVTWRTGGIAVDALALSLGKARLAGSLRLAQESIDGSLSLANLPLGLTERFWPAGLAGILSGQATVRGTRRAPKGELSATVAGLRLPGQPARLGLSLAVTGDWREGRLALDGRVSDPAAPPARLTADVPLRFERGEWNLAIPPLAPVSAKLAWQGDLAKVWQFVPLSEHQLSGPGTMDVRLGGTLSQPNLRGWVAVQKGRYESLQFGTLLKALDLRIDFDGEKAKVTRFTANDGGDGRMTVKGGIVFDAAAGHPFDLRVSFAKLAVLRRDDFEATASGTLRFKGTTQASVIEGALETERAEIRVLDRLPPDVVDLHVVEADGLAGKKTSQQEKPTPSFDPALKMTIEMPRRVFVRGRGIDSEWKGRIVLGGSVSQPLLSGNMETVRGQISVLGKAFRFQTGTVEFPDQPNSTPVMDITAVHEGRRITAQAHAQGPIKNPTITLTSTPSLPQDEIVSQILFDKGASKLSQVEAAQLAITLAQLSGKGGGAGNAMEFARKTLGVDVLRLDETRTVSGDRAAAVSAGKYLTEDVYIGVKQGASSESGAVGVEVEVTPNIVIESEVRRSGESDTSIKFKLDY
jgi:translocation and assembly module TamB